MIISLGIKPEFDVSGITEVTLDSGLPEIVCRYGNIFLRERCLRNFGEVVDEINKSPVRKSFCFSSDRILNAAAKYFIVHESCEVEGHHYSGLTREWLGMEDKLYCSVQELGDTPTVVHELIHLAHGYPNYRSVMESDNDELSPRELENAIEIATKLFLRYIPRLPFDIRNAQIGRVLNTINDHSLKDGLATPENLDRNCYFFKEKHIPRLRRSYEELHKNESFYLNGIFNNYYWEDIREVLLNGNFHSPKRQKFLFE